LEKAIITYLSHYPGICLENLSEVTKSSRRVLRPKAETCNKLHNVGPVSWNGASTNQVSTTLTEIQTLDRNEVFH